MYQIFTDKDAGRVEIRFDSIISRSLVGFEESLKLACMVTRQTVGYFDLLVDYTHSRQMLGDVLYGARETVAWCLDNGLHKSANITTDDDLRSQIEALSSSPQIRTFVTRAEAVAWLEGAQIIAFPRKRG